jgi:hypothetical protein
MAVHARPAAFAGSDGASYSVAIETERDESGGASGRWGAYLLFVRWSPGEPRVTGHLETPFLAHGPTPDEARDALGAMPLEEVKVRLDALIAAAAPPPERRWWDVMRDVPDEDSP